MAPKDRSPQRAWMPTGLRRIFPEELTAQVRQLLQEPGKNLSFKGLSIHRNFEEPRIHRNSYKHRNPQQTRKRQRTLELSRLVWELSRLVWELSRLVWELSRLAQKLSRLAWELCRLVWELCRLVWELSRLIWELCRLVLGLYRMQQRCRSFQQRGRSKEPCSHCETSRKDTRSHCEMSCKDDCIYCEMSCKEPYIRFKRAHDGNIREQLQKEGQERMFSFCLIDLFCGILDLNDLITENGCERNFSWKEENRLKPLHLNQK